MLRSGILGCYAGVLRADPLTHKVIPRPRGANRGIALCVKVLRASVGSGVPTQPWGVEWVGLCGLVQERLDLGQEAIKDDRLALILITSSRKTFLPVAGHREGR